MNPVQTLPAFLFRTADRTSTNESDDQQAGEAQIGRQQYVERLKGPPLNLVFEPFSFCPLHCCSCPTGRRNLKLDSAVLQVGDLESMLHVLSLQAEINRVGLFNWGEPTLCLHLPDLVRTAKRYGRTYISTTGNHVRCDLPDLVAAEPDVLIVATSGWTQEVYETTHEGGYVARFVDTCEKLSSLRARNVTICYHRYKMYFLTCS